MTNLGRNDQVFNWIFDISLVILTLTIGWIVPTGTLNKIETVIVLSVALIATIGMLHDREGEASNWVVLTIICAIGMALIVYALHLEPIWITFFLLWIQGNLAEALRQLDRAPHANLLLMMGLSTVFGSLVGLLRLGLLRLVRRLYRN